jgi:hypothetical protein
VRETANGRRDGTRAYLRKEREPQNLASRQALGKSRQSNNNSLAEKIMTAIPELTEAERAQLLEDHPEWELAREGKAIIRTFQFGDFSEAWVL